MSWPGLMEAESIVVCCKQGLLPDFEALCMGCAPGWSKFLNTSFPSPASNPDEGLESRGRVGRVWTPMSGILLVYALYWFFWTLAWMNHDYLQELSS